jgi:hypothetical protein
MEKKLLMVRAIPLCCRIATALIQALVEAQQRELPDLAHFPNKIIPNYTCEFPKTIVIPLLYTCKSAIILVIPFFTLVIYFEKS